MGEDSCVVIFRISVWVSILVLKFVYVGKELFGTVVSFECRVYLWFMFFFVLRRKIFFVVNDIFLWVLCRSVSCFFLIWIILYSLF